MTSYTVKMQLRGGEAHESTWTAATSAADAIQLAFSQLTDADKARVIGAKAAPAVEQVPCGAPECSVCAIIASAGGSAA